MGKLFTAVIEKRFLKLPVRYSAPKVLFEFHVDGECVLFFCARYDPISPDYTYYMDIKPVVGKNVTLMTDIPVEPNPEFSDTRPKYVHEKEKYRPKVHFTAPDGWINDPNGLFYSEGKYHLMYQHAPNGIDHTDCFWGHAYTENLVDFTHVDTALYTDHLGANASGCAVVDEYNLLGLNTYEHKAAALIYTAAGKCEAQYMAVSTDGGMSFTKRTDKPVIPHLVGSNRDPKIIYHKPTGKYIAALYLDGNDFGIFSSTNLTEWKQMFTLNIPGGKECPNFFPLTAPDGSEKWVFFDVWDHYYIGEFDGETFNYDKNEVGEINYGWLRPGKSVANAAQCWTDVPDGRVLRITWIKTRMPKPECFIYSMTVVQEVTLRYIGGKLKMCVNPAKEVEQLRIASKSGRIASGEVIPLDFVANDITLRCGENARGSGTITAHGALFTLDFDKRTVTWEWNKNGEQATSVAPLTAVNGMYEFRIITDTTCAELYTAGGTVNLCALGHFADAEPSLSVCGDNAFDYEVHTLRPSMVTDRRSGII